MNRVETLANNKEKYLVEIHMIKNVPTSHLNADDSGALKECIFGGTRRARISSQCLKNTWRQSDTILEYTENLNAEEFSYRTRKLNHLVLNELAKSYGYPEDEETKEYVSNAITEIIGKEEGVICFISDCDIKFIAYLLDKRKQSGEPLPKKSEKTEKKKEKSTEEKIFKKINIKKELEKYRASENFVIPALINIFGRMSTADAICNVDSSLEVSHALSTHGIQQESDYFTAVDDIVKNEEESGSGHIGETYFNSACYYYYANLQVNQFCENLMKNVRDEEYRENALKNVVKTVIEAVALENPKTKKTSFAASTYPECLYVVVKNKNLPLNLSNAFAEEIPANKKLVENSVKSLVNEIDMTTKAYGKGIVGSYWLAPKYFDKPVEAESVETLDELISKVGVFINE